MNIALVDDNPKEIDRLLQMINEYAQESGIDIKTNTFDNAGDFIKNYRPHMFVLVFMDIYMDGLSGIDAARIMREIDKDTYLVFLTTSPDYTLEAFDVHAYQYIIKNPFYEVYKLSIYRVLDEILAAYDTQKDNLTFNSEGTEVSLPLDHIVYIHGQKNYIQIIDISGNTWRTRMTFSEIKGILDKDSRFLQINRGILINMDHITSFSKEGCELEGGHTLPINVREQKVLDQIRKNYVFTKLHNR